MDLAALREEAGPSRFDAACESAWQTAQGCGTRSSSSTEWPDDLEMVPHEIDDYWWNEDLAPSQRLQLALDVYRAMPCYWNAALPHSHYAALGDADRSALWSEINNLLDDPDDRLADPVGYSLWCDWFEEAKTQNEAWQNVNHEATDRRLRRILPLSGPVPYPLKRDLYWRLAHDGTRWDASIAEALVASTFDVYGKIDPTDALRLVAKLSRGKDVDGLDLAVARLQNLKRRGPFRWLRRHAAD